MPDSLLQGLGGGALVAAALALVRLALDSHMRRAERAFDQAERSALHERDADARLERLLRDRLDDAERRLDRRELALEAERARRAALERELAVLRQAYLALSRQLAARDALRPQPCPPEPRVLRLPPPAG